MGSRDSSNGHGGLCRSVTMKLTATDIANQHKSIQHRLAELYSENIIAKILRTGTDNLLQNVRYQPRT